MGAPPVLRVYFRRKKGSGKVVTDKTSPLPGPDKYEEDPVSGVGINHLEDPLDSKVLPKFNLYITEEKEGSGGYATVYRAQRKSDGIKFAIKYPHLNADKHHMDNERKLLERFGGKSFVIKYEGCCRSENTDCIVLKHVEHDRPDVLKKEIDIFGLQWYAYCLFTALASLHKLGVVHRDVKPGNFLYSRKTCTGYLIDFNLAKDHNKQRNTGNSIDLHRNTVRLVSSSKKRKILDTKSHELAAGGLARGVESTGSKMLRKKSLSAVHRNSLARQGADGSGLTYGKDVISTRARLLERWREPLPCHGRKELINLAKEVMQIPKLENGGVPSSKRKITFVSVATMGKVKVQKLGPCPGTKGFRAPEVLLRSIYQGPKLDVWSAGVTLLFLMTGKLPFTGKPEQNMKDIVQMRGIEELLEVAKLHDCQSSLPSNLDDVQLLQSVKLKDWCKAKTKRPEFLRVIPGSLFDLVDKCLLVNPRRRISAEEALKHEFFAPCVDYMKKMRLLRRSASQEVTP